MPKFIILFTFAMFMPVLVISILLSLSVMSIAMPGLSVFLSIFAIFMLLLGLSTFLSQSVILVPRFRLSPLSFST